MTAKEFVKAIASLKPTADELAQHGLEGFFIEYTLRQYDIKRKSNAEHNDPLINLVINYDVSTLDVNNISFQDIEEDDENLFFGSDTGPNMLALYKPSGRIVAYNLDTGEILFHCAENSEKFLDALVEVMKFSTEKSRSNYTEEMRNARSKELLTLRH
ncbi:hypothetical protein [Pedobacter sp.]|uniref:hypothetical protein n=1 Tax=Pedobacter sp. TaxID=1411316 RepID=UPI00396C91EA